MSRIGVGEGTRAILYADFPPYAARVWWMLRAFGFDNAAVLNGGLAKWRSEGRPLSTEAATYPRATFVPRPRPELIASKEEVVAAIADNNVCIVNALLEPEYTGAPGFPHHYGRPGHIPRSVNVPFLSVVDTNANNQFIPADELRKRFADAGALTSERVITYCGGGIAASQAAYLLTLLGKENVALYNGSMMEWGADSEPAARDRLGTLEARGRPRGEASADRRRLKHNLVSFASDSQRERSPSMVGHTVSHYAIQLAHGLARATSES